eukprot:2078210-Pleurochrysis_carterae.AAC.1
MRAYARTHCVRACARGCLRAGALACVPHLPLSSSSATTIIGGDCSVSSAAHSNVSSGTLTTRLMICFTLGKFLLELALRPLAYRTESAACREAISLACRDSAAVTAATTAGNVARAVEGLSSDEG